MSSISMAPAIRETMAPSLYEYGPVAIPEAVDAGPYVEAAQGVDRFTVAIENMQAVCAQNLQINYFAGMSGEIGQAAEEQNSLNAEVEEGALKAAAMGKSFADAINKIDFKGIRERCKKFIDDSVQAFERQSESEMKLAVALSGPVAADEMTVRADMDAAPVEEAYRKITEKASRIQASGMYSDEAMITGAADLALHVQDEDAVIGLMDTLSNYAAGASGGQPVDVSSMQGYASELGAAMEGDFNGLARMGFQVSEAQKQIIANGSDMQKALALDEIVSATWGGLYNTMSNTPVGQIQQLDHAWGNTMTTVGQGLMPYIMLFVNTISSNWGTIETFVNGLAQGFQGILVILAAVVEAVMGVACVFLDNWPDIAPLVYIVAAALALLSLYTIAYKVSTMAAAVGQGIMQVAQNGLNGALMACPLFWIILAVIAAIVIFYKVIDVINQIAGTSISATGLIGGAIGGAVAFIWNLFAGLYNLVWGIISIVWNKLAVFANFLGNVFKDPIGAVAHLFFDLADNVLNVLEIIASAVDTIFGSELADSVAGWRSSLGGWVDETFGGQEEVMQKMDPEEHYLERKGYADTASQFYSAGEGIEESISDFDLTQFGTTDILNADALGEGNSFENPGGYGSPDNYGGYGNDSLFKGADGLEGIGDGVDGIAENTGNIAENTGAMSESMNVSQEDLKYLRDLAEKESINRFTTAEIIIEQTNNNQISSGIDYDSMISGLTGMVNEAVDIIAEGVYA